MSEPIPPPTPQNTPENGREEGVLPNVHTTPGGEETYHTDLPVGEVLRRARLHYGQSLEDVSRNIRIRVRQLDALEKGQWESLPGPVYAIGFVRSYAEYLRLDGTRMVALFKAQAKGAGKPKPDLNFPAPSTESTLPPWWIVAACVGVVGLVLAFWLFAGGQSASPPPTPDVPPAPVAAPTPTPTPTPSASVPTPPSDPAFSAAPATDVPLSTSAQGGTTPTLSPPFPPTTTTQTPEAADPNSTSTSTSTPTPTAGILLRVNIDSWVEIKDAAGKAIVARVLKKGEEYFVPDRPDLLMTLGNAGGVTLSVDGKPLAPLGAVGLVVRDVPLDMKGLVERYGKEE